METFQAAVPTGPLAISVGIMNGTVGFAVAQGDSTLMSESVTGPPFHYVVVTGSASYRYVNFDSNGAALSLVANRVSGHPVIAYIVYDNYISNFTASLITYPPQFGAPVWAAPTPVNTGMSVLLVAPKYSLPTPLSIQGNMGYCGPGQQWYAQIGFNDWSDNFNVSYFTSLGIFANFNYSASGPNVGPLPLIPGDTYNFTMALVSGTTWESLLNGTLTELVNLHSTYANCGGNYGMETLPWYGGSVNITNMIHTPVMLRFKVNGTWTAPNAMDFTGIGENWSNGNATGAPGISLWGMAGNLQDSSVPPGSLEFNDSLPMMFSIPIVGEEPVYGGFSFPSSPTGGGLVSVTGLSATSLGVSPDYGPTVVSLITYGSQANLTSARSALVTHPEVFGIPVGTVQVVVYAENTMLNETSSTVVQISSSTSTTTSISTSVFTSTVTSISTSEIPSTVSQSTIGSSSTGSTVTSSSSVTTLPVSTIQQTSSATNYVPYLIIASAIVVAGVSIGIGLSRMKRPTSS
jgi:hypothetical protein